MVRSAKVRVETGLSHIKKLLRTRRFWYWTGGILAAAIIVQLIIPYDRSFIGSTLDGQNVGNKAKEDIKRHVADRYKNASIATTPSTVVVSFKEAGVSIDQEATARQVVDYPLWQRIIPFSSIYRLFTTQFYSQATYSPLATSGWAKKVREICDKPAGDAGIAITAEGTLAVIPSKKGVQCKEKDLIASLKSTPLSPNLVVDSRQKPVLPKRNDQQVSTQLAKIKAVIGQGITVSVLGVQTKAEPRDIISWLEFKDGENGQLLLDVDPEKIQPFITSVQRPIYIAPGTTTIYTTDGQETSRIAGNDGRGVNARALITELRAQLQSLKTTPIEASVVPIAPKQNIIRNYTNTPQGLQALLTDLASEKGDMAIAVVELAGQKRSLSANGTKQYHPASTYKLVMAYSVIKRIEASQLKWDDQINGQTVDQCMTKMIVHSDNACAESFAEKFTWKAVQADARTIGMTGTNLNIPEPVSTVNDQAVLLRRLQNNELMRPENTTKLLDLMKQQTYRAGIPAGVSAPVADKVGFLSGLLHDSAIVYAPHGTYVISVYSSGGTWGAIAEVTKRIDALIAG